MNREFAILLVVNREVGYGRDRELGFLWKKIKLFFFEFLNYINLIEEPLLNICGKSIKNCCYE